MDRFDQLRCFVRTVELGSLSAAARELGISQSTASKWLRALERSTGSPLLDRTTRSHRLTAAGETLLRHARPLLSGWRDALAAVQSDQQQVQGQLRIALPSVFGNRHVVPLIGAFLDRWPQLEIELCLSDRYVRLVDEGFDVAIRVGLAVPSSLRARTLGSTPRRLVAAPTWLARSAGTPTTPASLAAHDCLLHSGVPRAIWRFTHRTGEEQRIQVEGRARADNAETLRQLAVAGQGVALLADWLVRADLEAGRLVALLPDWSAPWAPIRALLPPSRQVPTRVRAFLEHLEAGWARGRASPLLPNASAAPGAP